MALGRAAVLGRATAEIIEQYQVVVESLDYEGRGVAHREGKVVFIEGALIGERVRYAREKNRAKYEVGTVTEVLSASSARVTPRCPSFGVCGGCSMQHLEPRAQVAIKQRVLEDNLWHIGRLRPDIVYRPIHGPTWGYRARARLSVRNVPKKGGILVGFHEKRRSWIADMLSCSVLAPEVGLLLPQLRELVSALSVRDRLPQIEVAISPESTALVLRILEPLTAADDELLAAFAARHRVDFWVQTRGPETAVPLGAAPAELAYALPEFGIRMPFRPTDFTQVNHQINRVLVARAVSLLAPTSSDRVVDLFCGLGNFTLPIATRAHHVVGLEGSQSLVARARDNARANRLEAKTRFGEANLFEFDATALSALGRVDKMLIDPPRDGALAVARALAAAGNSERSATPARIVYVSCSPSTLARDAAVLVHEGPYRLVGAGIVNMFPHTSHVESIALFEHRPP